MVASTRKTSTPRRRKSNGAAATASPPAPDAPEIALHPSRSVAVLALVVLSLGPAALAFHLSLPFASGERRTILASTVLSFLGFLACVRVIPVVARANLRKGLFGRDINKRGTPKGEIPIPESLGLATGLVHIVCIVLFQQMHTYFLRPKTTAPAPAGGPVSAVVAAAIGSLRGAWGAVGPGGSSAADAAVSATAGGTATGQLARAASLVFGALGLGSSDYAGSQYSLPEMDDWTEKWLIQYNSALASISLMVFLGFADDVLDIPWRVKLLLPSFATLPIIAAYTGSTSILVPIPLRPIMGCDLLDLGLLYQVFMLLVVVFCTNSINILAGLNGLEAGQTLIIAGAVLLFNVTKLSGIVAMDELTVEHVRIRDAHLFSVYVTLPLFAVTAALLLFNYYPSRVFVGDTYTYFAGMALAVSGILGHFSETLLIFFVPQIINFVYSCPQLFKVVPCPRHRLPVYDTATGLLHPSRRTDGGYNLNLVTLFLRIFGPCTERALCNKILVFQFVSCALGFAVRHLLEGIYK